MFFKNPMIPQHIKLKNRITIEVRLCNFRTLRGPTYICVVCDEIAHWFTSVDYDNPDTEVLTAVRPALMTTRGPLLLASSAYARTGVLYDSYRRYFGSGGPADVLVCFGSSTDFNPSLPQEDIDRALERDPAGNRAEYLSEWRDDVSGFISRDIVESCIGDYHELPPVAGTNYHLFVDSASGAENGDSYAMGVTHRAGEQVITDAIRFRDPPFSPAAVVNDTLLPLARAYGIQEIGGDNYATGFAQELVSATGLSYQPSKKSKSQLYQDPFLPLLNSKLIVLPRHDKLISQICGLERRVKPTGGEDITHPTHGHDDIANAVAGAAMLAYDFGSCL